MFQEICIPRLIAAYFLCLTFSTASFGQSIGESVYTDSIPSCAGCHDNNIGPQVGPTNEAVWTNLLAAREFSGLAASVLNGRTGGMPAYSTLDLSQREAVVLYMLEESGVSIPTTLPPNSPPNIVSRTPSGTLSLVVGQPIGLTVSFTDEDFSSVSFEVEGPSFPALLSVESQGDGSFLLEPGRVGSGSFVIVLTDNQGQTDETLVPFDVENAPRPDNPPIVTPSATNLSLTPGDTQLVDLTIDDEDPSSTELSATSQDTFVAIVEVVGNTAVQIEAVGEGSAIIDVVVSDSEFQFGFVQLFVTVDSVPVVVEELPSLDLAETFINTAEGETVVIPVRRVGDLSRPASVRIELVAGSAVSGSDYTRGGSLPPDDLSALFSFDIGQSETSLPFEIDIVDDTSAEGTEIFELTFSSPVGLLLDESRIDIQIFDNDGILLDLLIADTQTLVVGGEPLSFVPEVVFVGDSGDFLTLTPSSSPAGIVRVTSPGQDGSILVEPLSEGTATVTVVASDDLGQQVSASFQVTVVVPENTTAPVAVDRVFTALASVSSGEGESQLFGVLENDSDTDGGGLTIELMSSISELGANLVVAGDSVRYQPTSAITSTDRFQYRVVNPEGERSLFAIVTVQVSDLDGDGVSDNADNCVSAANANQLDTDSDGAGDVCDSTPNGGLQQTLSTALGEEISKTACLTCHATGTLNAPISGDIPEWDRRFDQAGGLQGLVDNSITGIRLMPAFGDMFSAAELSDAILFLAGRRGGSDVEPDLDLDGVPDDIDNCISSANSNQLDSDNNGIGDICEIDADSDGDGLPFSIDDDDTNSSRLPGNTQSDNGVLVESDNSMRLGRIAIFTAIATGFSEGGVEVDSSVFSANANSVFGMSPVGSTNSSSATDPIDVAVLSVTTQASVIYNMGAVGLPQNSALEVYEPSAGVWRDFDASGVDSLASAASVRGVCPNVASLNYVSQLSAEAECIRLTVSDGDVNDIGSLFDGEIPLTIRIVTRTIPNDPIIPGTGNPSSSGGSGMIGSFESIVLGLLALFGIRRRRNLVTSKT